MHLRRLWRMRLLCVALCLAAQPAAAITIQIDYTYDLDATSSAAGTRKAQPRALKRRPLWMRPPVSTARFSPIRLTRLRFRRSTIVPFQDRLQHVTWSWQEFSIIRRQQRGPTNVTNPVIGTDQYVIYAGASSMPGNEAGRGGAGGYVTASTTPSGSGGFTQGDVDTISATTASLNQAITTRGEASGFSRWGGAISFDNDGSTPWFFNHLGTPSGNVTDFYSVAIHELGHTLGFGNSTDWQALVSGSTFVGANAEGQNNNIAVPLSPDLAHWVNGTHSVVYGTTAPRSHNGSQFAEWHS